MQKCSESVGGSDCAARAAAKRLQIRYTKMCIISHRQHHQHHNMIQQAYLLRLKRAHIKGEKKSNLTFTLPPPPHPHPLLSILTEDKRYIWPACEEPQEKEEWQRLPSNCSHSAVTPAGKISGGGWEVRGGKEEGGSINSITAQSKFKLGFSLSGSLRCGRSGWEACVIDGRGCRWLNRVTSGAGRQCRGHRGTA